MDDGENRQGGREEGQPSTRQELRAVYDEIASHFSETRAYAWPEIETFLDATEVEGTDTVGLDIGCGNGRHTEVLSAVVDSAVGLDVSRGLLCEARKKMGENGWSGALIQGDATALPLESETVDVALYIATLHHLPDRETRLESLRELNRVLTADGRALVSAWSTAHDRFDADPDREQGFETTVDWTLPDGETLARFYYIYALDEFERDIRESGLSIDAVSLSSGNCYAEVR